MSEQQRPSDIQGLTCIDENAALMCLFFYLLSGDCIIFFEIPAVSSGDSQEICVNKEHENLLGYDCARLI